MKSPEISVLVAVYNAEIHIRACIESILAQTYNDFEVVIVNDGSTDRSGAICDAILSKHTRIRVVHKENGGLSTARNAGLDVATGTYIVFVDADDTLPCDALKSMVDAIQEGDADIRVFGFCTVHEAKSVMSSLRPESRLDYLEALRRLLTYRMPVTSWGKLYRREFFEGVRFNPEARTGQDLLFNLDCISHKKLSVSICNVPVYNYILRRNSVSFKNDFRLRYGTLNKLIGDSLAREGLLDVLGPEFAAFQSINLLQASFKGRKLPPQEAWKTLVANREVAGDILQPFERKIIDIYCMNRHLGCIYLQYRFLRMRLSRLFKGL